MYEINKAKINKHVIEFTFSKKQALQSDSFTLLINKKLLNSNVASFIDVHFLCTCATVFSFSSLSSF